MIPSRIQHFCTACFSTFFLHVLTILLAVGVLNSSVSAGTDRQVRPEMDIAWSQADADRVSVFLCTKKQGTWGPPVKIHDLAPDNLHPTVDRDSRNRIWLAWTAIDYQDFQIHYTTKDGSKWHDPIAIPTETEDNIAPYLLVINNTPWLVWTGNNGDDDDVYFSRFTNNAWQPARMVHADNTYPDILPRLEVTSTGRPRVVWEQFSQSGYTPVSRVWDGKDWIPEPAVASRGKSAPVQSITYRVPGRVWDGRQWTKIRPPHQKTSLKPEIIEGQDENDSETVLQLPEFLQDIKSVYIRVYQP